MKFETRINGQKFVFKGTTSECMQMTKKIAKNEKDRESLIMNNTNRPQPDIITKLIEEKENFEHSMTWLIEKLYNVKSMSAIGKKAYYYIYREAEHTREYLSKKYNGKFNKISKPAENGKSSAIKSTTYVFEPHISNS